jgi:hypothetical protein
MANQHHPPGSGRSPDEPITAARPNCADPRYECSWVWNPGAEGPGERFRIKVLNGGCHHGRTPVAVEPEPDLRAWLTGDAA